MDYYDLQDQIILNLARMSNKNFTKFCNKYDIKTPKDMVDFFEQRESDEELEKIFYLNNFKTNRYFEKGTNPNLKYM